MSRHYQLFYTLTKLLPQMLSFLGSVLKPAARLQDPSKMREDDAEDSRKVTHLQDKVRMQCLRVEIVVIFMFWH